MNILKSRSCGGIPNTPWSCIRIRICGVINIRWRILFWLLRNVLFVIGGHFYHYFENKIKKSNKQAYNKNRKTMECPINCCNSNGNQKCKTCRYKNASAYTEIFIRLRQFFMPLYFKHKCLRFLSIIANFACFSQGEFV